MNNSDLMRKIQALSFAKVETELYLDAHPECEKALDYYKKIIAELNELMIKYQNENGPLFAEATVGNEWKWVKKPWPWQMEE